MDDFVAWIDKTPALIGCQVLMGVIFLIMVNVRLIIFPSKDIISSPKKTIILVLVHYLIHNEVY